MSKGDGSSRETVSTDEFSSRRRKLLAALGAGGAVGLAGCSGDGGDGGGTDTTDGTGTGTDGTTGTGGGATDQTTTGGELEDFPNEKMDLAMESPPAEYTWDKTSYRNQWARTVYPLCFARMGTTNAEGDIVGMAVDSWEITDDHYTVTLKDDQGWDDGSELLAADIAIPQWTGRLAGERSPSEVREAGDPQSIFEATEEITWDGKTFTWTAIQDDEGGMYRFFNQELFIETSMVALGDSEIVSHRSEARPELEAIQNIDAEMWSEDWKAEVQSIVNPTQTSSTPQTHDPTEQLQCGPFVLTQVREDAIIAEPNPNHRNADQINWGEVRWRPQATANNLYTALQTNNIDTSPGFRGNPPSQVIDAFPDNIRYHTYNGERWEGMVANQFADKYLGWDRVRQAMAYAIDGPQVASVAHKYAALALEDPAGLQGPGWGEFIDDELYESFNKYGAPQPEKAAQLMEDAGFTKEGNWWVTPEGEEWSLSLLTAAETVAVETTLISQLKNFGINVELTKQSSTVVSNRMSNGDFQLALGGWWGFPTGFYYRALQQSHRAKRFAIWSWDNITDWAQNSEDSDNLTYRTDLEWAEIVYEFQPIDIAKRWTITAPPVGESTYNEDEMVEYPVAYYDLALGRALDQETRNKYMRRMCWAFNWNLNVIPAYQSFTLAFHDHEGFEAPTEQSAWRQYEPNFRLIAQGQVHATGNDQN